MILRAMTEREKSKISIDPTLLISSIGIIDDVNRTVSMDVKAKGDVVYVWGKHLANWEGRSIFVC